MIEKSPSKNPAKNIGKKTQSQKIKSQKTQSQKIKSQKTESQKTKSHLPVPAPALSPEDGLSRYLTSLRAFPMLTAEQERELAQRWQEKQDIEAAHQLVTSHLRLVAKVAMSYRNYGLPMAEIVSEGNVGLMKAVKRFDPSKGFRLTTYAVWWIKASIQEYVLRSWSLVKIGTTSAQKRLFFNLRSTKREIQAFESGDLRPEQVRLIAEKLDVKEAEVISMNRRMSGKDMSLNAPISSGEETGEWQDWLENDQDDQETSISRKQEIAYRRNLLLNAMKNLNVREREVIEARKLRDAPATLEELSQKYNVSRERVRQIEVRAFQKLQKEIKKQAAQAN